MKEGNNRVKKPTIPTAIPSVDVPHSTSDNTPGEGSRIRSLDYTSRTSTINNIILSKQIPIMKNGNIRVEKPTNPTATSTVDISSIGSDNTSGDSSRIKRYKLCIKNKYN